MGYDIVNAWAEWDQDDQNIDFRSSRKIKPGPFCQINLRIKSFIYLNIHIGITIWTIFWFLVAYLADYFSSLISQNLRSELEKTSPNQSFYIFAVWSQR